MSSYLVKLNLARDKHAQEVNKTNTLPLFLILTSGNEASGDSSTKTSSSNSTYFIKRLNLQYFSS